MPKPPVEAGRDSGGQRSKASLEIGEIRRRNTQFLCQFAVRQAGVALPFKQAFEQACFVNVFVNICWQSEAIVYMTNEF
jgi:hypothetical protein